MILQPRDFWRMPLAIPESYRSAKPYGQLSTHIVKHIQGDGWPTYLELKKCVAVIFNIDYGKKLHFIVLHNPSTEWNHTKTNAKKLKNMLAGLWVNSLKLIKPGKSS